MSQHLLTRSSGALFPGFEQSDYQRTLLFVALPPKYESINQENKYLAFCLNDFGKPYI